MKFEIPTSEEIRAVAEASGFHWNDEDRAAYEMLVTGLAGVYAALDVAPEPPAPETPGDRSWRVPDASENPHNAWHVRTSLRIRDEGPLAGLRVALKDNVMLAGVPMSNGSAIFEGYVAEVDASVVTRLLEAGAEIAGKVHCEDLCASGGSHTSVGGFVHNPHRRGRSAGGSSSGSAAAVAAGDVELAVGGDQGGSIRIPAAYCGIVGMKPTWGLVPYTGIAPIEPMIDHTGPMTADVASNARMLGVLAGPDGIDARQSGAPGEDYEAALARGADGLRVGVLAEGFEGGDAAAPVEDCVRRAAEALAGLGCAVEEVSVPEHRSAAPYTLPLLVEGSFHTLEGRDGLASAPGVYPEGFMDRVRAWHASADLLAPGPAVFGLLGALVNRKYGRRYYARAARWARHLQSLYDAALQRVDCLLMPTAPHVAPPLPAEDAGVLERFSASIATGQNTAVFDATHHPALSVPCGTVDGLPVGMMLVGRHLDEATLYRIAHAFERSGDWRERS
ncbi:MAG: amidase [Myxococcota bacterium]